jgi:hypothetical protein
VPDGSPSGDSRQSVVRMSTPIMPPSAKKLGVKTGALPCIARLSGKLRVGALHAAILVME